MSDMSKFIVCSVLVSLLLVMTAGPAGSADGGRASGQFESTDITMKVTELFIPINSPA